MPNAVSARTQLLLLGLFGLLAKQALWQQVVPLKVRRRIGRRKLWSVGVGLLVCRRSRRSRASIGADRAKRGQTGGDVGVGLGRKPRGKVKSGL